MSAKRYVLNGRKLPAQTVGALSIERRKRSFTLHDCHNGCQSKMTKMPVQATHVAWLLGHATYLCPSCAKAWAAIWESELEAIRERAAA